MLVALSLGWAHIPHDQIRNLIAPPDLGTDEPWLLVADPSATEQLYESEDGGATWTFVTPDPYGDHLIAGGRMETGMWVLVTRSSFWYSEDQGDTWTEESFPVGGSTAAVGDTDIWYLGSSAIYSVKPGSTPVTEQSGSFDKIVARDGGVAAIEGGGDAWVYENEEWVELGKPLGYGATAVSANGKWVGTRTAMYARDDDDWILCGTLPTFGDASASQAVTGIYVEEPYLVATLASGGPIVSTDGCESWTDVATPDLPAYGVVGGTDTDADAYTVVALDGAHWIVGGWAGLYETFDAGITWDDLEPLGPDITSYPSAVTPDGTAWVATGEAAVDAYGVDDPAYTPAEEPDSPPVGCAAVGAAPLFAPLGLLRRRRRR